MPNNLIDNSNGDIVLQEKPIRVTDEKLKSTLWQVYERARKDARKFRLCNHYGVFVSIGSTLFISLLTSEFKSLGPEENAIFSSTEITRWAWIICVAAFIIGVFLAVRHAAVSTSTEAAERDRAVSEILSEIVKDSNADK